MSANAPTVAPRDSTTAAAGRNVLSGVLLGVGIAGFLDETVFHQLLHWHHFYDKSTPAIGLVSDGLFHAGSWFCTVAALFLVADLRRRRAFRARWWWGGLLIGARAVVLLLFLAAHGILAKYLYGHPPAGVPADAAQAGAELMYYGGDLIDVAVVVVFCRQWYRAADPDRDIAEVRPRIGTARPPLRQWRLPEEFGPPTR